MGKKWLKIAGTNSPETGRNLHYPITLLGFVKTKEYSIVFPEDGAWIIPIAFW